MRFSTFPRIKILIGLAIALAGCSTVHPKDQITLIPVDSFIRQWQLPLSYADRHDAIRSLYLRDDTLYAVSQRNRVAAITAVSGKGIYSIDVTPDQVPIKAPITVKDRVVFLGGTTVEVHSSKDGKLIDTFQTKRSIRSDGAAMNELIFTGLDYPGTGRLVSLDLTRRFDHPLWEQISLTHSAISAGPAVYQNNVYFADEAGTVYAISEQQGPVWSLEHSAFQTDGLVVADLKSDEGAIFVASGDSKLYCLDAVSGRLRWQYYASVPLTESPVITADAIYQPVRDIGLVAIDKLQGKSNRDAKWIVRGATRFLSQDEKFVYLLGTDNRILGCDRATGEVKFRSRRNDLAAFASNTKSPLIFACTRDGMAMAISPVIKPGTVGQLVLGPSEPIELVSVAAIK